MKVSQQELSDRYGEVCDVVFRACAGWPLEHGPDEAPVLYTDGVARAAALRIFEILDIDQ